MVQFQISSADWENHVLDRDSWHQHIQKGQIHLDKPEADRTTERKTKRKQKMSTSGTATAVLTAAEHARLKVDYQAIVRCVKCVKLNAATHHLL